MAIVFGSSSAYTVDDKPAESARQAEGMVNDFSVIYCGDTLLSHEELRVSAEHEGTAHGPLVAATRRLLGSAPKPDARKGEHLQISNGRRFWPFDPRPEDVHLEDIAHALSNLCRFGGHCPSFYSVAEHSVRVMALAMEETLADETSYHEDVFLAALLHDASEAYVVDLPRPIKRSLPDYVALEAGVARAIEARFGLQAGAFEASDIQRWDDALLATEARDLMGVDVNAWHLKAPPLDTRILEAFTPDEAKRRFLSCAEELLRRRDAKRSMSRGDA